LKSHLLPRQNGIALRFFAEIPERFAWEYQDRNHVFGFFVDYLMKYSLFFARAIPKFNMVLKIFGKEFSKFQ